ncbi:hypothetical protein LTR85_003743 [Meristemomyces frigidus]|nr:hypothetical protein LTR85_003743 [Meristemomyces frigidus]
MERLTQSIGSLLLKPKYSDLEIRCEGRTYYVHRAIIMKETDTGVLDLESTGFDALTLERMLQYLYTDDYTVTAANAGAEGTADNAPPTDAEASSQAMVAVSEPTATIPAIAHILVYAIAVYYELPLLKSVALAKLREVAGAIEADDLASVILATYGNTGPEDEILRNEIAAMALSRMSELMASESFRTALEENADMQAFAAHVLPAACLQAHTQDGEAQSLMTVVEMQHRDLTTTQKALQASEARAAKATECAVKHAAELQAVRQALTAEKAQPKSFDDQHNRTLIQLDNAKAKTRDAQEQAIGTWLML